MPKVNLGKGNKKAAKELEQNRVLSNQILLSGLNYSQLSEATGLHRTTISAVARDPEFAGALSLKNARTIAHTVGLSKSDWDRLGGYKD